MAGVEMEIVQQLLENADTVADFVENHTYETAVGGAILGVSAIGTAVNYSVAKYVKELQESGYLEKDSYLDDSLDD